MNVKGRAENENPKVCEGHGEELKPTVTLAFFSFLILFLQLDQELNKDILTSRVRMMKSKTKYPISRLKVREK